MATKKVGSLSDGADYSSLTLWNFDVKTDGGVQTVELINDITDNLSLTGWSSSSPDGVVTIKSDSPGVKRTVFSAPNGNQMIYSGDADVASLTVEDIVLDGAGDGSDGNTGQSATKPGITVVNGTATLTLNRVHIKNVTQYSVLIWTTALTEDLNCDNCIFESGDDGAYRGALSTTEATFRNCLFVKCSAGASHSHGAIYCVDDANNKNYFYNCLSFGNNGADFSHAGTASGNGALTYVRHCVSEDGTADDAHEDNTGSVANKTSTGTYFRDYANGDYRLRHDDYTNWTINGEAANTPATDYNNKTRRFNDIGPFEYFYEDESSIGQPTAKPIARAIAR